MVTYGQLLWMCLSYQHARWDHLLRDFGKAVNRRVIGTSERGHCETTAEATEGVTQHECEQMEGVDETMQCGMRHDV